MTTSVRHAFTFMSTAQAQKEALYNENLRIQDIFNCLTVKDRSLYIAPVSPVDGDAYLVAAGASGTWAGQSGKIAFYYGGWSYKSPFKGLLIYVEDEYLHSFYNGSAWVDSVAAFSPVTTTKTANYTATSADRNSVIPVNATAAARTIFLPVVQDLGNGFPLTIKKMDSSGNAVVAQAALGNLLTYSEELDNAAWTKTGSTITANAQADYLGNLVLDKIAEDTSTGNHQVRQSLTKAASALTYTLQVELKASERSVVQVMFSDGTDTAFHRVNLSTGATVTVGTTGSFSSASGTVTSLGSGLYWVTLTATTPATTTLQSIVRIYEGASSYTGVSGNGLFAGKIQTVESAVETPYYRTTASAGQDVIDGANSQSLTTQYQVLRLVSDKSNNRWLIV